MIHKFVSKDPNKELPKEVTDLLPTNQTGIVKGDEVRILFFCEFFWLGIKSEVDICRQLIFTKTEML